MNNTDYETLINMLFIAPDHKKMCQKYEISNVEVVKKLEFLI